MRALAGLVLALAVTGPALAAPVAAPGYTAEVVTVPGAIFAGLAQDGDDLLVTNLGDGRLYRRTADGTITAFGLTLPHGNDVIGDPVGPYNVAKRGDGYIVAQGWTPADKDEGPYDHALLSIDARGALTVIDRNFWNPFAFVADGERLFVVDSAKNTVERLQGGARTTLWTFPRLSQKGPAMTKLSPTEFSKETVYEVDAVPTGIALHDGRVYVTLFGGFPYVEDGGVVMSLDPEGGVAAARLEQGGFNTPVGVAFDGAGNMLVLLHGTFDQASGFVEGSGALVRIDKAGGGRTTLLSGLTRPAALLVEDDGHMVVSELGGALVFLTKAGD